MILHFSRKDSQKITHPFPGSMAVGLTHLEPNNLVGGPRPPRSISHVNPRISSFPPGGSLPLLHGRPAALELQGAEGTELLSSVVVSGGDGRGVRVRRERCPPSNGGDPGIPVPQNHPKPCRSFYSSVILHLNA